MSSKTRQQLEDWVKEIKNVKGNVIDIGGSQSPITKRLNNNELYIEDYKILDLKKPHECKEKPDFKCDINDEFKLLIKKDKEYSNYFDIAFCLEVSEYWWNPIQALKNINKFLKQGGILYISFHFVYPVHNPVEQDYLRYTEQGARKLLKEAGFLIEEIKPRLLETYIGSIDGMRPAKDYNKHDWAGTLIKAKKI